MQLPFESAKNAEPLQSFEVGQTVPGTSFRVESKLSESPGYATYAVLKPVDDQLYVCECLAVDSELAEATATNALFCKGRTRSSLICNIVEAAWMRNGAYYQILDVSSPLRVWTAEYADRIISANDFRATAHQLLTALLYLHKTEIVHGAISPNSILLDGNSNKLSGFWWARNLLGDAFDARVEKFYPSVLEESAKAALAPEVERGEKASRQSDIYSLGATFFFMLTGEYPFKSANAAARPEHLQELRSDLAPHMVRGVQIMLEEQPHDRDMFAIMSLLAPIREELDDEPELEEV